MERAPECVAGAFFWCSGFMRDFYASGARPSSHPRRVGAHFSIQSRDMAAKAAFYDAALAPLGGGWVMDFGELLAMEFRRCPSSG